MYAFAKSPHHDRHTQRYTIEPTAFGWEVREEHDSRIVRQLYYQDWHRVERARRELVLRMSVLKERGWVEADEVTLVSFQWPVNSSKGRGAVGGDLPLELATGNWPLTTV